MEWVQHGVAERIFTFLYRYYLRSHADLLYHQLGTIIDQRIEVAQTILVVATHFGLAHQLAAIKEKLKKEKNVSIVLIVQVTDDSPQYIWYVDGADIIFVPSSKTKRVLEEYGRKGNLPKAQFYTIPYPISPLLQEVIPPERYAQKYSQLDPESRSHIHTAIPISGAAVGTDFFSALIDNLHQKENRFLFSVISKFAPYTKSFLANMMQKPYVRLEISSHDREVVDLYEKVYAEELISLEVTKPSEQAFKALINPHKRGGALLLFSKPVGRQEYDNLDFLRRHHLIPSLKETRELWQKSCGKYPQPEFAQNVLFSRAVFWRGVELPEEPKRAAQLILFLLREKIFLQMLNFKENTYKHPDHPSELSTEGVTYFWKYVSEYLRNKNTRLF